MLIVYSLVTTCNDNTLLSGSSGLAHLIQRALLALALLLSAAALLHHRDDVAVVCLGNFSFNNIRFALARYHNYTGNGHKPQSLQRKTLAFK